MNKINKQTNVSVISLLVRVLFGWVSERGRAVGKMALSSWRENFSSGVSFLRRRFSSNDLQSDDDRGQDPGADTAGLSFNLPASGRQRSRTRPSPSAPSSPSKSTSSGYGMFARGLFSSGGGGGQRAGYNKDRCKTLLIIDEPHVDWYVFISTLFSIQYMRNLHTHANTIRKIYCRRLKGGIQPPLS